MKFNNNPQPLKLVLFENLVELLSLLHLLPMQPEIESRLCILPYLGLKTLKDSIQLRNYICLATYLTNETSLQIKTINPSIIRRVSFHLH